MIDHGEVIKLILGGKEAYEKLHDSMRNMTTDEHKTLKDMYMLLVSFVDAAEEAAYKANKIVNYIEEQMHEG